MKAAHLIAYGGPENVELTDSAEKPVPGEGEVLIQVHAAAVNPFDVRVRDGMVRHMAELSFPAVLGGDVAGTVAELGPGVEGFTIGQEVYGLANALSSHGSFAEFTNVVASQLSAKPTTINFTAAAAFPQVATSAYQALVDTLNIQPGQKVLIHGGAGGIGSIAIQIAHNLGAHVATTAAPKDIDYVQQLGADEVIDYTSQNFADELHDFDAVYDTIGGQTNKDSYRVLRQGGSFVSMIEQPDAALVAEKGINYTAQFTQATSERLAKIAELIDAGKLTIYIDEVFPLEKTAEALEYFKNDHPRGKVVIQVAD